jgi:hypothetical protein
MRWWHSFRAALTTEMIEHRVYLIASFGQYPLLVRYPPLLEHERT